MIKRLHIRNYLSLKDVELKLGTRNVLIGPNMAGKSNLIDGLRFLCTLAIQGVNQAILDRNGFPEVLWKGGNENKFSFELTFERLVEGQALKIYEYGITIQGSSTGFITIEKENLIVRKGNK